MEHAGGAGGSAAQWWDRWGGVLGERHEVALDAARTALVIIDMQYLDAHRDYGIGARAQRLGTEEAFRYYFDRLEQLVVPNIRHLQAACRAGGVEVMFARIASATREHRDVNRMQRRHGVMLASVGSKEAEILDEIHPIDGELVITKGCSGLFNGTAIDQILRNMGIDTLVMCGVATNYCVETSVRDAADRNYEVIMVADACAARNAEQERLAAEVLDGIYCRVRSTDDVLAMVEPAARLAGR